MKISPSRAFLIQRIKQLQHKLKQKKRNLKRLSAIRDDMNQQVKSLREEITGLSKPALHVGEFLKFIGKEKALVKMSTDGKYITTINKEIDRSLLKKNTRVALNKDSYEITRILKNNVDPIVSLMKVEKVPDSTYDMLGGLTT